MVEGPEYRRHAELLQCLVGQRLVRILRAHPALEAALAEFFGLRILRVFSVGKEIFAIFESRRQIEVEDGSLRMHLGESGGYIIQPKGSSGVPFGPKIVIDSRHPKKQPLADSELELSGCIFSLWDSLGSRYETCPWTYIKTVEARLPRDVSFELFDFQAAAPLIQESSMMLCDLIMNQAILPGVGNIIKCEGLFTSRLHPLRLGSSLTLHEIGQLLVALCEFARHWFDNCRLSLDGARMGCSTPLCYGRSVCTSCGHPLLLIKEGIRRRITFFCSRCQECDTQVQASSKSKGASSHHQEIGVNLPVCRCRRLPVMQLMRRPGNFFGHVHAICALRRNVNQPGCAGQHRGVLHKAGCSFFLWLDKDSKGNTFPSECACGERMVFRRVMEIHNNGQVFLRCKSGKCGTRIWLVARNLPSAADSERVFPQPAAERFEEQYLSRIGRPGRWRHTENDISHGVDSELEIKECAHTVDQKWKYSSGKTRASQKLNAIMDAKGVGKRAVSASWSICPINRDPTEAESDSPVTSGEDEDEAENEDDCMAQVPGQFLNLLSLEASSERLANAKCSEPPPVFEKRWRKRTGSPKS